ncbi:MAG TPA: DNA-directed RNA polymerase subunit delta [Syntrophomonadaceae bacterium]|nr:DNA-directed RNA polymerase subunit delta [Syntrophomonadaceae bacterium]
MILRKKSEADWAIEIMTEKQEPIFYADLIKEIATKMKRKKDKDTLTSIYTRLNMDNRLDYQGEGYWFYDINRVRSEK